MAQSLAWGTAKSSRGQRGPKWSQLEGRRCQWEVHFSAWLLKQCLHWGYNLERVSVFTAVCICNRKCTVLLFCLAPFIQKYVPCFFLCKTGSLHTHSSPVLSSSGRLPSNSLLQNFLRDSRDPRTSADG